jgi:transporter family-2 protein
MTQERKLNLSQAIIAALIVAVGSGIAIGTQSTLTNWGGRLVGPLGTGLLTNIFGGTIAGVLLLIFAGKLTALTWDSFRGAAVVIAIGGALGVGIIAGVAFSLPRVGITAGMSAIILGQMLVGVIVDAQGWGGLEPIPLNATRILGLVLLVVATWLLVPRSA